jgi:uncharacterized membrane protein YvbJ
VGVYCTKCGAELPADGRFCTTCGTPSPSSAGSTPAAPESAPAASHPAIPNHLVEAILATVCCCVPFGIVSIVYAAQVNSKIQAGDLAGARSSSESAKIWAWISFAVGLAGGAIYGVIAVLGHLFR